MQTRIDELILKHLWGELTPEEHFELNEFKNQSEENRKLVDDLTDRQHLFGAIQRKRSLNVEAALQKAKEELFQPKILQARYYWIAGAAAVLLIAIVLAGLFINKNPDKEAYVKNEKPSSKKKPSSPFRQAILTLGNGLVLNLQDLEDGSLGDDPMLTKNDTQLIYPLNYKPELPGVNFLETPIGSSYSLRLPDGTIAWLNSGSSIQYPNSFTGNYRTVVIQGEVYFEVAKNPSMPFIVKAQGMEIEVKGTKFAVNAYKKSRTFRTTLVEGSVKIKGEGYVDSLRPGEQAILTAGRKYKKIKVDSPEQRLQGWKENKFVWTGVDARSILDDLSQWYGYTIIYEIDVPSLGYTFTLERKEKLETILKVLQSGMGLQLRLENKTIIVSRLQNTGV